jgi:release factor glutamine methyltransferase
MPPKPRYTLHSTTEPALAKMRAHRTPYVVAVENESIVVFPGVWSPAYDWSVQYYGRHLPDVRGKRVLDMGCGTGILGILAARAGAAAVTAVDINPEAVANANANFHRLGLSEVRAIESDAFTKVSGIFDVVLFNAPFHGVRPRDMLERACADENYTTLRHFFRDLGTHLDQGGIACVGFSESGDLDLFRQLVDRAGLKVVTEFTETREGYNCLLFHLTRRAGVGV